MTPAVVVDASVAIKWFVTEADSHEAERLLAPHVELHAPLLLMTEFANALWKNVRKGLIDLAHAQGAMTGIRRTIAHWHATEGMLEDALEWSIRVGHPVYDILYVALAQRNGLRCVTADWRFVRKLESTEHAERVVHLSEWNHA